MMLWLPFSADVVSVFLDWQSSNPSIDARRHRRASPSRGTDRTVAHLDIVSLPLCAVCGTAQPLFTATTGLVSSA